MLDGASRNMAKALGTLEFIENPPERAALLALKQDTDNLITRMTRKSVGAQPSAPMEADDEGAPEMGPDEELRMEYKSSTVPEWPDFSVSEWLADKSNGEGMSAFVTTRNKGNLWSAKLYFDNKGRQGPLDQAMDAQIALALVYLADCIKAGSYFTVDPPHKTAEVS